MEYLLSLGHKRIGIVNIPIELQTGQERFDGYKKLLRENNIKFDSSLVKYTEYRETLDAGLMMIDTACEKTNELLSLKNRPTAIVSTGIFASVGILKCLQKNKISIPEEISFLSFDELFEYSELQFDKAES